MTSRLNVELFDRFKKETGERNATYQRDGMTMHTLKYVNWLEAQVKSTT